MIRVTEARHGWGGGIAVSILDLYCSVDEFWQQFAPWWEQQLVVSGARRRRPTRLHPSEIMTIAILFQQSGYRTFKEFYTEYVQQHLRGEFPHLLSYTRFVEVLPRVLVPLTVYLHTHLGQCSGGGRIGIQVVHARCCGLDVHKKTVVTCVLLPQPNGQVERAYLWHYDPNPEKTTRRPEDDGIPITHGERDVAPPTNIELHEQTL
jgi:hypothetical protein